MKKTNEQFIQLLKTVDPNICLLEPYVRSDIPILVKCAIDNYIWKARPNDLLRGHGCPKCKSTKLSNIKRNSIEKIKEVLLSRNITLLSNNYTNNKTKVLVKCNICGHEWDTRLDRTMYVSGCPLCAILAKAKNKTLTLDEFVNRVKEISPELEILRKYNNTKSKIKCKCNKCNTVWYPRSGSLLNGVGCPHCHQSKGEKYISKYLKEHNINYYTQYVVKSPLFFKNFIKIDFYLPDYNAFIEYNGIQHYIPVEHFGGELKFKSLVERDNQLRVYCKETNINLLEIRYDEDIEKSITGYLNKIKHRNY